MIFGSLLQPGFDSRSGLGYLFEWNRDGETPQSRGDLTNLSKLEGLLCVCPCFHGQSRDHKEGVFCSGLYFSLLPLPKLTSTVLNSGYEKLGMMVLIQNLALEGQRVPRQPRLRRLCYFKKQGNKAKL